MRQTIIAPQSAISNLKKHILKDKSYALGTSVRPFNFAFNEAGLETQAIELACFKAIQGESFERIGKVLSYPKTIQQFIQLVQELDCYGIPLDNLPVNSDLQHEIAKALTCMRPHIPMPHVNNPKPFKAYQQGLTHAQHHFIMRHGIPFIQAPTQTPIAVNYHMALNPRSEFEAVVQNILTQKLTQATILVPNFETFKPMIESVFARYHLPLRFQNRSVALAKAQFLAIVALSQHATIDALIALVACNPLGLQYLDDLIHYIQHFELSYEQMFLPFDYAHDTPQYQEMFKVQVRIQEDVLKLQTLLTALSTCTYHEVFALAYLTIQENTANDLVAIQKFLEKNARRYTQQTHAFFLSHFAAITANYPQTAGIVVDDIKNIPHTVVEDLYVVGLLAKNFPAVASKTGLLDEVYVSQIAGFPALDQRIQHSLNDQNRIFNCAKNLTLSFYVASYEGKAQEVSYPVARFCEDRATKLTTWPLKQQVYRNKRTYGLRPDIAQQLYLQKGAIEGSITAFQMYLSDPYQFFMERGLKLRKPEKFAFDARVIGTLNHAIMENTLQGQDRSPWMVLEGVFPKHSPRIAMIRKRNQAMMDLNIAYIQDALQDTSFEVKHSEFTFYEKDMFANIGLRGIIDRIDISDQNMLIIDYKSGLQALSETNVKAGSQLQLLTYAMIAAKSFQMTPLGVFYFGFRNPNIAKQVASYSLSKGIQMEASPPDVLWRHEKRYNGWFFVKDASGFESADYFTGLNDSKTGLAVRGRPYDFDKIRTLLKTIYKDLQTNILSGVLDSDAITMSDHSDLSLREDKEDVVHDTIQPATTTGD